MNRIVKTALLAALLAPFWILGTTIHQVNFYQTSWQEISPGDCLMILGARTIPGNLPGLMMRERLATAEEEISDSVEHIIVTGGTIDETIKTEAEVMKDHLVASLIPSEKVHLEDKSRSTYENLQFSKEILEEADCERLDIISHDFHLARVKMTADNLGIPVNRLIPAQNATANTKARLSREHLAYLWYWLGWSLIHEENEDH